MSRPLNRKLGNRRMVIIQPLPDKPYGICWGCECSFQPKLPKQTYCYDCREKGGKAWIHLYKR